MFSKCPRCETVFSVSESHVDAYHGLVRCGRCQAVFEALANEVSGAQGVFDRTVVPTQKDAFDGNQPAGTRRAGEVTGRAPPLADPGVVDHDARGVEPLLGAADEADDESSEVVADTSSSREPELSAEPELPPGAITEEILIEAPPLMGGEFEEPESAPPVGPAVAGDARAARTGSPADPVGPRSHGKANSDAARRSLQSPYRARDVRMVELPRPRPFKTATLSLSVVLLALLLIWQGKIFYLDEFAQQPLLRPYLEQACRVLGCVLSPRRDFVRIDVVGTSIDVNPEVPAALEIRVGLINRAHFPQPYPPLQVTLSDSEGRIVGRRTYTPEEYLETGQAKLLPIRESRDAVINLATPPRRAVGYEVDLVAPRSAEAG